MLDIWQPGAHIPNSPAAGLRTTASDLSRVILEIQDAAHGQGKILSKESAKQMLTAQDEKPSIGLGFFLAGKDDARRFSMDGWNYGFTCRMVGFVDKGEGAVVMTNSDNGALMFEVLDAIGERIYAWPVQPSSCKTAIGDFAAGCPDCCRPLHMERWLSKQKS